MREGQRALEERNRKFLIIEDAHGGDSPGIAGRAERRTLRAGCLRLFAQQDLGGLDAQQLVDGFGLGQLGSGKLAGRGIQVRKPHPPARP
ncbi:MAG TPA: hypothetical protein PLH95_04155, partial [Thauera aminoaromatica]|nr:hypothetical protein [Thauera aminoaromatica]